MGKEIQVEYRPNAEPSECTVARKAEITESNKEEYLKLAYLHYRSAKVVAPIKIFTMRLREELIGSIVYAYPSISSSGRRKALGYTPRVDELNSEWAAITRVIVHPMYRSIGLGAKLVRETLPLAGRRHIELIAVMAQYNSFADKAGMKRMLLTQPSKRVLNAINRLQELGFNPALLSSRVYNEKKLRELDGKGIQDVKEALLMADTHYYRRISRVPKPYMKKAFFTEWLKDQDAVSLAWSMHNLAILSQSKAYLYWYRDWEEQP